jgi:hypothetical protein
MRLSRQDICSDDVLPQNPGDNGLISTARKVTPNTDGIERKYLDLEEIVNLINQFFGTNRWSSAIRNMNVDLVRSHIADRLLGTDVQQADSDPNTGRTSVGVSTIIRVTLANGTFHEVCPSSLSLWRDTYVSRASAMDMSQTIVVKGWLFERQGKVPSLMAFKPPFNSLVVSPSNTFGLLVQAAIVSNHPN